MNTMSDIKVLSPPPPGQISEDQFEPTSTPPAGTINPIHLPEPESESPPIEDQVLGFSIQGWAPPRIASVCKISVADVKQIISSANRQVKQRAIKVTEHDLVADLVKLRYLEKHLFAQTIERPTSVVQYLKIKEEIESKEKILQEMLLKNVDAQQSKAATQHELLKLELQKKKGELVSRQEVDNVLEVIVNLLQASLQQIKVEQNLKQCKCFDKIYATVQDISETITNGLGGSNDTD